MSTTTKTTKKAAPKGATPKRTAKARPAKSKTDGKAKSDAKPRRTTALDAAAQVLTGAKTPLNCRELVEAMAEQGLWSSPAGKTPHATLYSAILREIAAQGTEARFVKIERGRFARA